MRPGRAGRGTDFKRAVVEASERANVRDVAAAFGVSTYAIWTWRNAAGLPKRKPGPKGGTP